MDVMTRAYFNQKRRKIPGRTMNRDEFWTKLTEQGGGWVTGDTNGKQKDVIRPQIQIRRDYHSLFPSDADSDNSMFELPEVREFGSRTADQLKTLMSNIGIIVSTIKSVIAKDQKKVDVPLPSSPKILNSPRKRISRKTSCDESESQPRTKRIRPLQSEASSQCDDENIAENSMSRLLKRPASSMLFEETHPVLPEQGEEAKSVSQSKHGKRSTAEKDQIQQLEKHAEKISTAIQVLEKIADGTLPPTTNINYAPCRPWMSREIAYGTFPAQHLPQWVQKLLFPSTCDIDIVNCGFTLAAQLLDLIELPDAVREEFSPELQLLDRLSHDRNNIVTDLLKLPMAIGKTVLLETWMGKKNSSHMEFSSEATALLDTLSNLGRLMRWVALSYFDKNQIDLIKSQSNVKWVEGSAHAYMYQSAEAYCMKHFSEYVLQKRVKSFSMAFDGGRVHKSRVEEEEDFMKACAEYIASQTHGFRVQLVEKHHLSFYELLTMSDFEEDIADLEMIPECALNNSCSAALVRLFECEHSIRALITTELKRNPDSSNESRTFESISKKYKLLTFKPYIGAIQAFDYPYLLLAYKDTKPITFGVWPSVEVAGYVNVCHMNWKRCVPKTTLIGFLSSATDRYFMSSFLIAHNALKEYPPRLFETSANARYNNLLSLETY